MDRDRRPRCRSLVETSSVTLYTMEDVPIEIRALTPADAAAFRRLRLEALEGEPQSFGESPAEHQALTLEKVAARLESNSNFVAGAFADGQLIATAGFFREQSVKRTHKGRIWGVYVDPRWRAKGLGRRLLSSLIERARALPGLEQISLTVNADQAAAKRLYASLGFEIFGHESGALKLGETYVDEDHMVLRLLRWNSAHRNPHNQPRLAGKDRAQSP
jgi:ribosomal protein S18 acetylase RimI-like enzyme